MSLSSLYKNYFDSDFPCRRLLTKSTSLIILFTASLTRYSTDTEYSAESMFSLSYSMGLVSCTVKFSSASLLLPPVYLFSETIFETSFPIRKPGMRRLLSGTDALHESSYCIKNPHAVNGTGILFSFFFNSFKSFCLYV